MTKRPTRRTNNVAPPTGWIANGLILVVFISFLTIAALSWLVPIELFEQWAFDRAGTGTYNQFEAVGEMDFIVWMWRGAAPLMAIFAWRIWSNLAAWKSFAADVYGGLADITQFRTESSSTRSRSFIDRCRTVGCRGLFLIWFASFITHSGHAIGLRAHDWPYFRFNSGQVVLPNISDSNRAVIRYISEATPPNARILVVSDQKLFFLSYYLRPRTLFHRMHPDSEHVIPLKDQERRLAAYRLDELTTEDRSEMPHDYTLEYFEHPDLVDAASVLSDPVWVSFIRQRERNPSLIPAYMVRLQKVGDR